MEIFRSAGIPIIYITQLMGHAFGAFPKEA